jgi:hypothetical protein
MRYLYAFGLHIGVALVVATFLTFAAHTAVGESGEATAWSGLFATLGVVFFLPFSVAAFAWMARLRRRGAANRPALVPVIGGLYGALVPAVILFEVYRNIGGGWPPIRELARVVLTYGGVGAVAAYLSLRVAARVLFPAEPARKG